MDVQGVLQDQVERQKECVPRLLQVESVQYPPEGDHGQVQSELFAAYLQLSQATKPDPVLYKEVSDRIEKAKGALTQTEQAGQVFEAVLEQIIATWGSGFKVHTDIASSAMAALRKDPIASA